MASLPVLHQRRQSSPARAAKTIAKAYATAKGLRFVGRPLAAVAVVPVAVGGVLAWRKSRRGSSNGGGAIGPVAHASAVSPPSDPTGALTDPPAGEVNPPVGPRAAT
jgi:hypothetical protein